MSKKKTKSKPAKTKKKGGLKKIIKGAGKGIKKATKKIGKGVVHGLKNAAKGVKEGAEFAVLVPFLPAMLIALKAKHVAIPKKHTPKIIASLFYVNVLKGQHLEHCEHLDGEQSGGVAFGVASTLAENSGIPGAKIGINIVHAILDFFTGKKKQKAASDKLAKGEVLSDDDKLTPDEQSATENSPDVEPHDAAMVKSFDKGHDDIVDEVGGTKSTGEEVDVPDSDDSTDDSSKEDLSGDTKKSKVPSTDKSKSSGTGTTSDDENDEPETYGVMKYFHKN